MKKILVLSLFLGLLTACGGKNANVHIKKTPGTTTVTGAQEAKKGPDTVKKAQDGKPGKAGRNGKNGLNGEDGTNFISDNGVPNKKIGKDGESYLDLGTYDLYTKKDGVWTKITNLKGPAGNDGKPGVDGKGTDFSPINDDRLYTGNGNTEEIINSVIEQGKTPEVGDEYLDLDGRKLYQLQKADDVEAGLAWVEIFNFNSNFKDTDTNNKVVYGKGTPAVGVQNGDTYVDIDEKVFYEVVDGKLVEKLRLIDPIEDIDRNVYLYTGTTLPSDDELTRSPFDGDLFKVMMPTEGGEQGDDGVILASYIRVGSDWVRMDGVDTDTDTDTNHAWITSSKVADLSGASVPPMSEEGDRFTLALPGATEWIEYENQDGKFVEITRIQLPQAEMADVPVRVAGDVLQYRVMVDGEEIWVPVSSDYMNTYTETYAGVESATDHFTTNSIEAIDGMQYVQTDSEGNYQDAYIYFDRGEAGSDWVCVSCDTDTHNKGGLLSAVPAGDNLASEYNVGDRVVVYSQDDAGTTLTTYGFDGSSFSEVVDEVFIAKAEAGEAVIVTRSNEDGSNFEILNQTTQKWVSISDTDTHNPAGMLHSIPVGDELEAYKPGDRVIVATQDSSGTTFKTYEFDGKSFSKEVACIFIPKAEAGEAVVVTRNNPDSGVFEILNQDTNEWVQIIDTDTDTHNRGGMLSELPSGDELTGYKPGDRVVIYTQDERATTFTTYEFDGESFSKEVAQVIIEKVEAGEPMVLTRSGITGDLEVYNQTTGEWVRITDTHNRGGILDTLAQAGSANDYKNGDMVTVGERNSDGKLIKLSVYQVIENSDGDLVFGESPVREFELGQGEVTQVNLTEMRDGVLYIRNQSQPDASASDAWIPMTEDTTIADTDTDTTTFLFEGVMGQGDLNSGSTPEEMSRTGRENGGLVVGDMYYNMNDCEAYRFDADQKWRKLLHSPFGGNCTPAAPTPTEPTNPGNTNGGDTNGNTNGGGDYTPVPVPSEKLYGNTIDYLMGGYLTGRIGSYELPYIVGKTITGVTRVEETVMGFGTNNGDDTVEDAHVLISFELPQALKADLAANPGKVTITDVSLEFETVKISNDMQRIKDTEIFCQINFTDALDHRKCSGTPYKKDHERWDELIKESFTYVNDKWSKELILENEKTNLENGKYRFTKKFTGENRIDLNEYLGTDVDSMIKDLANANEPAMFTVADDTAILKSGNLKMNVNWKVAP